MVIPTTTDGHKTSRKEEVSGYPPMTMTQHVVHLFSGVMYIMGQKMRRTGKPAERIRCELCAGSSSVYDVNCTTLWKTAPAQPSYLIIGQKQSEITSMLT